VVEVVLLDPLRFFHDEKVVGCYNCCLVVDDEVALFDHPSRNCDCVFRLIALWHEEAGEGLVEGLVEGLRIFVEAPMDAWDLQERVRVLLLLLLLHHSEVALPFLWQLAPASQLLAQNDSFRDFDCALKVVVDAVALVWPSLVSSFPKVF
jgi:hypothetical protein